MSVRLAKSAVNVRTGLSGLYAKIEDPSAQSVPCGMIVVRIVRSVRYAMIVVLNVWNVLHATSAQSVRLVKSGPRSGGRGLSAPSARIVVHVKIVLSVPSGMTGVIVASASVVTTAASVLFGMTVVNGRSVLSGMIAVNALFVMIVATGQSGRSVMIVVSVVGDCCGIHGLSPSAGP